jgi:hypothetical protein
MAFGLNPFFSIRWALSVGRNMGPVVTPPAVNQLSTAVSTQTGTGTVIEAALAYEIGDYPRLLWLLQTLDSQRRCLSSSKTTAY